MTLLKRRIADTDDKLKEMKDARKASDKARRHQVKQTRADHERKVLLVGEAILRRVDRGEMDEAEFRQIMDDALSRPADRALFGLDDDDPSA
ncbi:hypothetical protein [Burkholderia alba]|uniref:hypothetical protein n=1 Tax=Burkholderia alba TaxID=2683677 RepID=UPI002B057095|nr:hypothetical protein [Burkholderia alba]